MTQVTDEQLVAERELSIVNWQGRLHCAYLNDFRIAGEKPWGGGDTAKRWSVTLKDVIRAFPELQQALGFDYLGNRLSTEAPVTAASEPQS